MCTCSDSLSLPHPPFYCQSVGVRLRSAICLWGEAAATLLPCSVSCIAPIQVFTVWRQHRETFRNRQSWHHFTHCISKSQLLQSVSPTTAAHKTLCVCWSEAAWVEKVSSDTSCRLLHHQVIRSWSTVTQSSYSHITVEVKLQLPTLTPAPPT